MKKKNLFALILALCLMLTVFAGCRPPVDSDGVVDDNEEHYDLKFYMPIMGSAGDLDSVVEEVNKITEREINASVEIIAYNYYEYSQKMTNVLASSEKFDICHTSPAVNFYFLNVQRKAFFPLDYILPKYAPETYAQLDKDLWEQLRVNGNIYASANLQILPRTFSYYLNDFALMEEFLAAKYPAYTFDTAYQIKKDKLSFMEEYLLWLRSTGKGLGGITSRIDMTCTLQNLYGFDDLSTGMGCPGAVRATDDLKDGKLTVVNQFESDEYKNIINYATKWRQMGLIPAKVTEIGQSPERLDACFDGTWKPGSDQIKGDKILRSIRLSDPTYFQSYILGTMNAISTRSGNPARAMKFIELMSTDVELHNLLQFGIEGQHYTKVEGKENRIEILPNATYDNHFFGWGLGNEFKSYLYGNQPDDLWEQVQEINNSAKKPSVIGFNFNPEPVKQKIADCLAVSTQYTTLLSEGGYPDQDAAYKEFLSKLKVAGSDEIIAEKQRQLDAWVASRK